MIKFKRILIMMPILLGASAITVSSVDHHSLIIKLCEKNNAAMSCNSVSDTLDWLDWISGSSSTQFHFIDLLELITP
ncbi:MAG: hypothetical protein HRU24_12540 [Gammaproteobacteria bacterium]|nr:hypothetical protein [Gammaproteobacteria bacterium]